MAFWRKVQSGSPLGLLPIPRSLFDEPLARPPLLLAASVLAALALPPAPRRRPGSAFWPATAGLLLVAVLVGMIIQPTRAQALALKAAGTTHPARQAELLANARRVLPGQVHYALAEGKLLLRHAARPLDLKSYARIRVVADRAVALDPRRADGHLLRARLERRACIELLRTEASCARATADYRLAVLAAPTDALLLREQAGLARLLGRPGDAAAGLRQAVALEPAFAAAWYDLGELLLLEGELEAARAAFLQAQQLRADHWAGSFRLAEVAARQGDPLAFEVHLKEALRRGFSLRTVVGDPNWARYYRDEDLGEVMRRFITVYADESLQDAFREPR